MSHLHQNPPWKKYFPLFQMSDPWIYLDSAATTQKPKCVIDTISDFYSHRYGTVHRAVYELSQYATEQYNLVREKIARFIHAKTSQEIIFTKGTTESINLVASTFGKMFLESGDEILLTATEHHANLVPWQLLAKEKGLVLKFMPVDDEGHILIDQALSLMTTRTKFVALAHIANTTGIIHPIKTIIDAAHDKGAVVLIDGAQATSHITVDVQDLDADFYVFSGHKMYGPTGIGILYGKYELLAAMPPYQGGGDMIREVFLEYSTFQDPPMRFERGTPMIAEVLGLGSAVDFISSIGLNEIEAWENRLFAYFDQSIRQIKGLKILGDSLKKAPICSFNIEGIHSLDLATMLSHKHVAIRSGHMCSQPTMRHFGVSSCSRVSLGLYNTYEDIDLFMKALHRVILQLT